MSDEIEKPSGVKLAKQVAALSKDEEKIFWDQLKVEVERMMLEEMTERARQVIAGEVETLDGEEVMREMRRKFGGA